MARAHRKAAALHWIMAALHEVDPQTVSDLLARIHTGRFRAPVDLLLNCISFLWGGDMKVKADI